MKRGIMGLSIAVLALMVLVQLKGVESEFAQKKHGIILNQIELEKTTQVKNDVENAYRQVLEKTRGKTIQEQVAKTAANLLTLEGILEKEYADEGFGIDLWFGATTDKELTGLRKDMIDGKKTIKCADCFDYSKQTPDYEKNSVPLVTTFLRVEKGKNKVSKNGGGAAKPTSLDSKKQIGNIALGCSLYANASSSNCFVGEEP